MLEWDYKAGEVVVRRVDRYTWEDIHRALFPEGPPEPRSLEELKQAIGSHLQKKHARPPRP